MRVAFFGTPQFAVPTLERLLSSPHTVVGVVTQPDRPRGRGQAVSDAPVKALARARGLAILQPASLRQPDVEAMLRSWQPDLGVVAAYGKLIPESLLALPRFGMINVHASLLPQYRGAAPIHRAVIDGATTTGVTIMRVAALLDAGAMFAHDARPIGPDETSDVVERDLAVMGANLLLRVIDGIAAGTAHEEPQDNMLSTYAPRLTKAEGLVDWHLPASSVHNRVRGLSPWPHAYSYLAGARLILLRTHLPPGPEGTAALKVTAESGSTAAPGNAAAPRNTAAPGNSAAPESTDAPVSTVAAEPGTVVEITADTIYVAAAHGRRVGIDEVQTEGRRPMRVREFLAGHLVQVGMRFSGA